MNNRLAKQRDFCGCGCGERVHEPGAKIRHGHKLPAKLRINPNPASLTDGTKKPKKYEHTDQRIWKRCTACGEIKPKDGFDQVTQVSAHGTSFSRCMSVCKPCSREAVRARRKNATDEEIEILRAKHKAWTAANKEKQKNLRFLREYGITLEQFSALAAEQKDACLICQSSERPLVVDHCHTSNGVRGLLCSRCNSALGLLSEDATIVSSMLEYIKTRC